MDLEKEKKQKDVKKSRHGIMDMFMIYLHHIMNAIIFLMRTTGYEEYDIRIKRDHDLKMIQCPSSSIRKSFFKDLLTKKSLY